VHLGLALHHEGFVAVNLSPRDAALSADGTFLLTGGSAPPTLLLAPLVAQHVAGWASESTDAARAALGYIWLLRADPQPRLDLSVSVLLDSGRAAEALAPSPALSFIEPAALRSLVLEVSSRLAGRGRVSQAARLLYQRREFSTLASLLADELSTAIDQAGAGDAPATLRLAAYEEPADAAARAARLRSDADAFLKEWAASDPAAASRQGMPLSHLIRISALVDGALAWREAPRGTTAQGPAPSLPSLLAQLDGLSAGGLLPTSPATVDAANAEFRLQPPSVQVGVPLLRAGASPRASLRRARATLLGGDACRPPRAAQPSHPPSTGVFPPTPSTPAECPTSNAHLGCSRSPPWRPLPPPRTQPLPITPRSQRVYPVLIEVSIQLLHAYFASLRSARQSAPADGGWADLERVRAQAEGIFSFGGSALWSVAGVLGQVGMPARAAQRLARYLADMT
jgi:hypothetical protein